MVFGHSGFYHRGSYEDVNCYACSGTVPSNLIGMTVFALKFSYRRRSYPMSSYVVDSLIVVHTVFYPFVFGPDMGLHLN